ncbi:MAG TPA: phosphohydrolase [Treponema sp.]|nr:phosphohydrolase [Treponema sp.]
MKSPKERAIEKMIIDQLIEGTASYRIAELLMEDPEVQFMQEYANTVSIVRLGYNDHGPVHMRTVTRNAVAMVALLHTAGISLNIEKEKSGTLDDSLCAVILASFLHDLGMALGRQDHELHSITLGLPIIDKILAKVFPNNPEKRIIIRSVALEGIIGHMSNRQIYSIEAGIILVADGCDMEKGRARIPMVLNTEPRAGDIHKYSANSIEQVTIEPGKDKPIRISVEMSSDVGFFQIEEVFFPKLNMSPVKQYLELYAGIAGTELKKYL